MKNNAKKIAKEMVLQEKKNSENTYGGKILDEIPKLFEAVQVDVAEIRKIIVQVMKKESANPLSAVMGLFGLRVVKENTFRENVVTDPQLKAAFSIDENALQVFIKTINAEVTTLETQYEQQQKSMRSDRNDLIKRCEKMEEQKKQEERTLRNERKVLLEAIQHTLSTLSNESEVVKELQDSLNDLQIEIVWDSAAFPAGFSVLKKSNAQLSNCEKDHAGKYVVRPCFLQNKEVLVRGFAYEPID